MVTERERRLDRYADAIYDAVVDNPMWIGDDGKPLDYLPARETRMADFVYQAAAAVMAVADAEQAQLRAEVDDLSARLSALLCDLTRGRMSKTNYDVRTMVQAVEESFDEDAAEAEAKVARVEALLADYAIDWRDDFRREGVISDLRAALEGS